MPTHTTRGAVIVRRPRDQRGEAFDRANRLYDARAAAQKRSKSDYLVDVLISVASGSSPEDTAAAAGLLEMSLTRLCQRFDVGTAACVYRCSQLIQAAHSGRVPLDVLELLEHAVSAQVRARQAAGVQTTKRPDAGPGGVE